MGLAMQSTMTYVVLRCVTDGMCNEWEDTRKCNLENNAWFTPEERDVAPW